MRANEFVNEGFRDWVGKNLYNLTGVDDKYGNRSSAAGRDRFIGNFKAYFSQVLQSAKAAGAPMDVQAMVNSYLAKNKWTISSPQQKAAVDKVIDKMQQSGYGGGAVTELANLMYMIGAEQIRDKYGSAIDTTKAAPATDATQTTDPAQADATANTAQTGSNPPVIPKGKTVELNGKQYQWQGAQWALYNPMTGKASQMAPKNLVPQLNQLAQTPEEPMTPDAIAARRQAKQKAAQAKADATGIPIKKKPQLSPQQKFQQRRVKKQKSAAKKASATSALMK